VPIVEPIIQATWLYHSPKSLLPPPSAEAARNLKSVAIDVNTGTRLSGVRRDAFQEYFRLDSRKQLRDTQHALVDRRHVVARAEPRPQASPQALSLEERLFGPAAPRAGPPEQRPRSLRELLGL